MFEDEESTGISAIAETTGAQAEAWYTIGGQRLQGKPSTKGLYIVNGKEVPPRPGRMRRHWLLGGENRF